MVSMWFDWNYRVIFIFIYWDIYNLIYFIGGLSEEVDEKILHAAFIPFGDIVSINIPPDYTTKSSSLSNPIYIHISTVVWIILSEI